MNAPGAPSVSRVVSVVFFAWSLLVLGIVYAGLGARYSLHPEGAPEDVASIQLSSASSGVGLDAYASMAERPLFNESRRPIAVEGSAGGGEVSVVPAAQLNVQVTSVVITAEREFVIVYDQNTKQSQTLKPGESLAGDQAAWKLVELKPRSAVFEGPGGRTTLDLRVFDGKGGEAPTRVSARPASATPGAGAGDASGNGTPAGEVIQESPETANADAPESRAEQIRRRIEERRRQMREEAEKAKAERGE